MTAIRFATSIVLGLVATTSAFAAEPAAAPAPASPVVASSVATVVTLAAGPAAVAYKASPKARYCFRVSTPGTQVTHQVCKTRAAWQSSGMNFDAALAGR